MYFWVLLGMESDDEIRRVPDMGCETGGTSSASGRDATAASAGGDHGHPPAGQGQKKKGRSPADKENKRLKRLVEYIYGFLLLVRKSPICGFHFLHVSIYIVKEESMDLF